MTDLLNIKKFKAEYYRYDKLVNTTITSSNVNTDIDAIERFIKKQHGDDTKIVRITELKCIDNEGGVWKC